jgi:transmembrane sensor
MKAEMIDYLIEKILTGTANSLEKEDFEKWLLESGRNKVSFDKMKILWEKLDETYGNVEFDKTAAKESIRLKILERQKNTWKNKTLYRFAVAASMILLLGLGLFVTKYNSQKNNYLVYTTKDAVNEIVLTDGSHIWLNTMSILKVPKIFSKKEREITLRGEAYFEIARDESKPFKILTGNTVTEVLGTSFNVELDTLSGNVKIVVNSGKVAFYNSGDKRNKEILLPGNLAVFLMKDQVIKVSSNDDLNFLSWKTGTLKFYNTPIDQVCNELTRHFNKKVFSTITAKDLKLTGTFQNDSLEEILSTIKLTLDVHVSKQNNEYCIEN